MHLEYSIESRPLGTGGAIRLALPLLRGNRILLLNGDSYCDVNLQTFCEFQRRSGRDAGMVLTYVDNASRFGKVQLGEDGCIASFEEKSPVPGPGWINAGVYLLDRGLIENLAPGQSISLERDVLPTWVFGGKLAGFRTLSPFIDIGLPESYRAAARFFAKTNRMPKCG